VSFDSDVVPVGVSEDVRKQKFFYIKGADVIFIGGNIFSFILQILYRINFDFTSGNFRSFQGKEKKSA
jgi:ABC-type microcin C transport system permease subunit YejB